MAKPKLPRWPKEDCGDPAPPWYEEAFRNALQRVVCVLNSRTPFTTCARLKLNRSDAALATDFEKKGLHKLIQFNVEAYDRKTRTDEHLAEHHFYANASFEQRDGDRVAVFKVPRAFLDWGYQNLRRPPPDSLVSTDFPRGQADPAYVTHCATNYLVKNFWHNFVHGQIQGINQGNYGEFRGLAREDSDFEADHIANLLTLRSYGIRLHYSGQTNQRATDRINAIFARNRCNQIFAKRARHRLEDTAAATDDERWAELEWRFCRGVANRLSIDLLAHHLAAPSISIFLGGDARHSRKSGRWWRYGNVLAEVARRRFATDCRAYVPDDELRAFHSKQPVDVTRQTNIRRFRAAREEEIVIAVRSGYRRLVHSSTSFSKSIGLQLKALETRIDVDLL